ncbi:hypothetical protein NHX12_005399, partial [Muraenolepis orangiensis]
LCRSTPLLDQPFHKPIIHPGPNRLPGNRREEEAVLLAVFRSVFEGRDLHIRRLFLPEIYVGFRVEGSGLPAVAESAGERSCRTERSPRSGRPGGWIESREEDGVRAGRDGVRAGGWSESREDGVRAGRRME